MRSVQHREPLSCLFQALSFAGAALVPQERLSPPQGGREGARNRLRALFSKPDSPSFSVILPGSRRVLPLRDMRQRVALAQHVVDFVKDPLAAAGRPAGAHRREIFASVDAEIASGPPAGEAFGLAGEIVQRAFQPGEPAAEGAASISSSGEGIQSSGIGRGSVRPMMQMRGKDFARRRRGRKSKRLRGSSRGKRRNSGDGCGCWLWWMVWWPVCGARAPPQQQARARR